MNNFEKNDFVVELFDIYKEFLTSKQKKYFEFYFFEDFSLQEIAEEHEISRAAVFDSIKNAIKLLEECEQKIGSLNLLKNLQNIINQYKDNDNLVVQEILKKIEKEI
ncbi:YlxM family DNA-binding protein [Spiroplasma endosymbiont of Panorpa germanica]|uniref:YlxM family DNA-binding protein n=1 Tax=Spiroplasma endosymbiont of Panorpa germanica TaxID=3066314 RepID=UPI0030D4E3C2